MANKKIIDIVNILGNNIRMCLKLGKLKIFGGFL